ncbi:MAG: glycosyltransferase [Ktedonobacteraceae bacterium]
MIETTEIHDRETAEILNPDQPLSNKQGTDAHHAFMDRLFANRPGKRLRPRRGLLPPKTTREDVYHAPGWTSLLRQMLRFGMVGGLNTLVDLLILNGLLLLFPTTSTLMLLAYNSLAYSLGAVNSFLLNKYWTFGFRQRTTRRELIRFTLTTLCGIGWSTLILWLASRVLHPLLVNTTVWANASKAFAIVGTALISYLGMYLWVFVSKAQKEQTLSHATVSAHRTASGERRLLPAGQRRDISSKHEQRHPDGNGGKIASSQSLSIVLPAYNEEQVIASTVADVLDVLNMWQMDVEVLVVNDGSTDRTGAIVAALAAAHPRVRLITHPTNQGYGAALVSGFAAATKELTFFMDADGQFDIRDLQQFFPFIDEYNAVIGYRLDRQDSWMRKLNAWGWKRLIGWVLDVHVRDVDCAFKLLHTEFLRQYPLETRGAMINAELLKLFRLDLSDKLKP